MIRMSVKADLNAVRGHLRKLERGLREQAIAAALNRTAEMAKGIRHLVQMMNGRKLPTHAIKDDCIEGAETLLRHAGLTQIRGNLYGRQP